MYPYELNISSQKEVLEASVTKSVKVVQMTCANISAQLLEPSSKQGGQNVSKSDFKNASAFG